MKAITLWQPWATLCFELRPCPRDTDGDGSCSNPDCDRIHRAPYKGIETRSWPCPPDMIGQRIAIHAAARGSRQLPREARPMMVGPSFNGGERFLWPGGMFGDRSIPLPRGVIVGTARIAACVPMTDRWVDTPHIRVTPDELWLGDTVEISAERPFGDYAPGRFGWILNERIRFEQPIPAKGRQRLWNLPDDLGYLEARGAVTSDG